MKTTIAILALLFSTLAFADHFPTSVDLEKYTVCTPTYLRQYTPINWLLKEVRCQEALTGKEIQRGEIWGTAFAHNLHRLPYSIQGLVVNPRSEGGQLTLNFEKRVKNVRIRLVGKPYLKAGLSLRLTETGERTDVPDYAFLQTNIKCDHHESYAAEPPVTCYVFEAIIPQIAGSRKTLWIESYQGEASILKVSSTNREPTYYPVAADTGGNGGGDGEVCVWNDEDNKFDCEDA